MEAYKEAFETLAAIIKEGNDEELIEVVLELEEGLKDVAGEELTKEEWESLTYTERVKLKKEQPAVYKAGVDGKLKGAK